MRRYEYVRSVHAIPIGRTFHYEKSIARAFDTAKQLVRFCICSIPTVQYTAQKKRINVDSLTKSWSMERLRVLHFINFYQFLVDSSL